MKPIVMYHENCIDGFGAAFSAWLHFRDTAEYVPVRYRDKYRPEEVPNVKDREAFVFDFAFPPCIMERFVQESSSLVWLDHHKSSFDTWCGEAYLTPRRQTFLQTEFHSDSGDKPCLLFLDNRKCGALLAWEHFHPTTPAPTFIRYIDDYDRERYHMAGVREFAKAVWSYAPWSFDKWAEKFLHPTASIQENSGAIDELLLEGEPIMRAHMQNVRSVIVGGARECHIPVVGHRPFRGLAANCPDSMYSSVGAELAKMSGTYGLSWFVGHDLTVHCSLRSQGSVDVSTIARSLGGGGHKDAAGFRTDMFTLMSWLK